jgi:TonB family protein
MNASQILINLIAYGLQVGLLVGIGAALPGLVGLRNGRAPAARLLYWQVLLAACLALPWLRPWRTEVIVVSRGSVAVSPGLPGVPLPLQLHHTLPSLATIGLLLLGVGAALRVLWLLFGFLKLARHRRHGVELPLQPEWKGMVGDATILLSDDVRGPVTFGFFRPVVLLPAAFPLMPQAMRDAILSHELLHVARRDWAFTLIEEFVRAAFWFHPAIWWVLGEIQLTREQTVDHAVIQMTQARDPYVDTLLAMAGAIAMEPDLAPAPSFLRRRHLKQRVIGLIQESSMSKTKMLFAQSAALAMMAAASWLVTGAIPLRAQTQTVTDGAGVTVSLDSSQLLHRPPLYYPAKALAQGVEGTVVVQAHLDASGEVTDDSILSGPDALRKDVQQAVLSWHFDGAAGGAIRVVNITFAKGPQPSIPSVAMVPMTSATVISPPQALERRNPQVIPDPAISEIVISGLPDGASDRLRAQLPVHTGDTWTADLRMKTVTLARQFDEHLRVSMESTLDNWTLRISEPDAPLNPQLHAAPAGTMLIGGNVMSASLINLVRPVYPPLAKMARQQGTVRFQALIGTDGTVQDLQVLPGAHPLLVQAATQAAQKWVYKPTIMGGTAVPVSTTIDINFALSD